MTRNLLVGIAETAALTPPREFLVALLSELATLDVSTQVVAFEDGPVLDALAPLAEVRRLRPLPRRSAAAVAQAGIRRANPALAGRFQDLRTLRGRRDLDPPDCIHLHGALAMPLLRYVRSPDVPVTVYVHPWDYSIAGLPPRDRRELVARTERFLVADDSVVGPLLDAGVPADRIVAAPDVPPAAPEVPTATEARRGRRATLGLPADRPVVAILPAPGWSDLPDLTLALVWEVERRRAAGTVAMLWFGVPEPGAGDARWPIDHEVAHMGLTDLGVRSEVPTWDEVLEIADLVLLPAASADLLPDGFAESAVVAATPLLCWADHPRAEEVRRCGGTVAERGDVVGIATAIVDATASEASLRRARTAVWRGLTSALEQIVPLELAVP